MSMERAVDICKQRGIVPVGSGDFTSHGTGLDPVDGSGSPWQAYVYGCQVAEVEVDTLTGEVQVLGIWAAHDVGRAINPRGVEGQIEGGVVQGLGQALMEDYQLKNGTPRRTASPNTSCRPRSTCRRSTPASSRIVTREPARRQGHRRAGASSRPPPRS